jgi:glycosyltransferase involved in cell wall biosynthesis
MNPTRHITNLARALVLRRVARQPTNPLRIRVVYATEGAPARYRVHAQIEQARLAGMIAEATRIDQPESLYDLHACDLLIFYRTPLGPRTAALLLLARRYGIRTAFDSDDLVWDVRQREYEFLDRHYEPAAIVRLLRTARRTAALMRQVDALILSTPFLARMALASFERSAFVCMNALSTELIARSELAYRRSSHNEQIVRIGYFSGQARSHDEDLASISAPLAATLAQFPHTILTLCGEVTLPPTLAVYHHRIERRPMVDWRALPHEIARVDINIAPLIDNPQRRGKSGIKYFEAALVGVPTIAAQLEPYSEVLIDRHSGMLAQSPEQWRAALALLVEQRVLRQQLGKAAYAHVLSEHTTAARAPRLAEILQAVMS